MKGIYFIPLMLLVITACNSEQKKKEDKVKKEVLFGEFKEGNYSNPFFNISIDFDENWEVNTKSIKSISFGGDLLSAVYVPSYDEAYPITLTMETNKANPFGSKSPVEQLEESQEGYEMLFDSDELSISEFDKVSIAGEDYVHGVFTITSDKSTSYVHEYYRYYQGYFISIVCVHNTIEDEAVALDIIRAIKRKK